MHVPATRDRGLGIPKHFNFSLGLLSAQVYNVGPQGWRGALKVAQI